MKRILAVLILFFAIPLSAQTIAQQPTDQTVLVGQSATFTVTLSSGTCRSFWLINGSGHYGALANSISYVIANTVLAQNGTTVQVQLYGCTAGPASLISNVVKLFVNDVPLNINLTVSGSMTFEDSTAVYNGAITVQQWNGTFWMPAGNVASDASGVLSGTLTVNPNWVDASGNVEIEWSLPGATGTQTIATGTQTIPLAQFQQGSTGLVVKLILFKAVFLAKMLAVTKSSSIALTP